MFISWICIIVFLLLLFFPTLSVQGASQGLLLWYQIVVPTLAPFMLVTQIIQAVGGIRMLVRPVYPFLHRCYHTSVNGCYILLCGLLCGYPVGARLCADFRQRGQISPLEADCLLAVCNHPSPMFLLGYVRSQLAAPGVLAPMMAAIYLPVPLLYWLAVRFYSCKDDELRSNSLDSGRQNSPTDSASGHLKDCFTGSRPAHGRQHPAPQEPAPAKTLSFGEMILSTSETLVIIGGTLMLFSVLIAWIQQPGLLSGRPQALVTGFLEITTGVHQICQFFPIRQRLLPTVLAVTFGGCSGILQTYGVIRQAGLSIRHYIGWKCLHTLLSAGLLTLVTVL